MLTIVTNSKVTTLPNFAARNWDHVKRAVRLQEFCAAVDEQEYGDPYSDERYEREIGA